MAAVAPATSAPRRAWGVVIAGLLGLVVMLGAACAPAPPAAAALAEVRVITDDDPRWAGRDVADDAWPRQPIAAIDPAAPVWWLRGWVRIDATALAAGRPLGMAVVALASCEAYWDGAPLGANGTVSATAGGERPGRLAWLVALPADVTAGDHLVSLRCSAHHRGFEPSAGFYGVWIADYGALATIEIAYAAPTLISAGALLTVGVFYLLTFLLARRRGARARDADRHRAHLWLGTFAIAAGALVLAESARALVGYTYDVHLYRLIAIAALAWLVNVALLAFVTRRFALPGRRAVLAVGVTLATLGLAAPGFDRKVALAFLVGLVLALGWTAYALLRRRWHAGFAAAGLAGCLAAAAWRPGQFLDFYLFVTLGGLCLCLLVAHVLAEAHDAAQREALELRSARLEIELLRRQLQPHFLMNTLTALSEWLEAEPAVAAEMVEHVGRELRLLSEISRHTAVPLATELALCRSHLAVMARRRDEQLTLDAEGVDGAALIPPALFHTLTENALSHNTYRGQPAVFRLRQTTAPRPFAVRYTFDAPLVAGAAARSRRARHRPALHPRPAAGELRRGLPAHQRGPRSRRWRRDRVAHGDRRAGPTAGGGVRVLIVEDEAVIARRLERLVREILGDQLGRLDVCAQLAAAADRVAAAAVDLVFLDLDLEGDDGFDLLRHAVAGAFHTVVVSAHTDRAIEAFALGVVDFVPKPFTIDRLRQAVDRARGLTAVAQALRYLAVRGADGIELIPIERVHHIAAADDYAELHLDDGTTRLHDKSLATLAVLLPAQFVRIHRSHVVDLRRASHLRAEAGSRYALVLTDGTELPVGRTRVAALRARLI